MMGSMLTVDSSGSYILTLESWPASGSAEPDCNSQLSSSRPAEPPCSSVYEHHLSSSSQHPLYHMTKPPHEVLELAADRMQVSVSVRMSGSKGCAASEDSS